MMVTVAPETLSLTIEPATTEAVVVVVVVVVVVGGTGMDRLSELPHAASKTTIETVDIRAIFVESIAILPLMVAIFIWTD
ncbi:MAG: hypothetical protein K2X55_14270 [Burkholderiaceae bacterium]|nr:hypothetical protein [Burkholderiaceae bacterium]